MQNVQPRRSARPLHWLPLPGVRRGKRAPVQTIDDQDGFTKGEIVRLFREQGFGFLRRPQGDDIYIARAELHLSGAKTWNDLCEGMKVGFDVAWTSKGLHVTKLKIY